MAEASAYDVDVADLRRAIELIRGVVPRHPLQVGFPLLIAVDQAVHDVYVIMRYVGHATGANEELVRYDA